MPGGGNAIEVGLQGAIGLVRVMAADRINNVDMLLIAHVIMFVKLVLRDGRACGDEPVQQGDMDSQEDRIPGNFRQYAVKFNV